MNEFIMYLNNAIETAGKKEQELIATERKDEANLQNDVTKILIEETKLETLAEVKAEFRNWWER